MKNLLIKSLAGSGLLLMTLTASAQYQPRWDYRYQTMQDRREGRSYDELFDRVRDDLDRARSSTLPFTGDRNRVMRAEEQVNECQQSLKSDDFDRRTFGDTISSIQRIVDLNRLSDQNRDYLMHDINALRGLESRLESER